MSIEVVWSIEEFLLILPDTCLKTLVQNFSARLQLLWLIFSEHLVTFQGQLLRFLRSLKDKGKKLFLMTNSPYHFVDGGMRYLMEVIHIIE